MPDNRGDNRADPEDNSGSRHDNPPVATVTPSKKTYDSIASDISVNAAVGELIDNALDSAALHGMDVAEIEIRQEERDGERVVVVEDQCGGVDEDEMGVFMGLGQSRTERADDQQVGTFGMGSKRALRRLGRSFRIESRRQGADQGWGYTVPEEWFEPDDEGPDQWSFELDPVDDLSSSVTRLELRKLEFDPEAEAEDLREWIGRVYHKFLQDHTEVNLSLEISVFGETVTAPDPVEWSFSPWFGGIHPYRFEGFVFTDHNGEGEVQARVTVGIMREGNEDRCGTFVYGQNRLIEGNLTDERGGFGVELNKFTNSQHKRLRIEIELFGDADDLPWSADKSRLRPNHHTLSPSPSKGIYWWLGRLADRHMKAAKYGTFGDFVGSANVFEPYGADSELASNDGSPEVIDIADKQRRLRRGEVSHVRIRGKPSDDYRLVNRLGRTASAHARLGVAADVTDLDTAQADGTYESWARPTYERQLGRHFVAAYYDTDEGALNEAASRLLDVDDPVSFVETAIEENVGQIAQNLTQVDANELPPVDDWNLESNGRDQLDRKLDEINQTAPESVETESLRASDPAWAAPYYRACVATHVGDDQETEEFEQTERGIFESDEEQTTPDAGDTEVESPDDGETTVSRSTPDDPTTRDDTGAGLETYTDEESSTTGDGSGSDGGSFDGDGEFSFTETTRAAREETDEPSEQNSQSIVERLFADLDEDEEELVVKYLTEEALDDEEVFREELLSTLNWLDSGPQSVPQN